VANSREDGQKKMSSSDEEELPLRPKDAAERSEEMGSAITAPAEARSFVEPLNYSANAPLDPNIDEVRYPRDLQISWTWVHGLVFAVFILITLSVVPLVVLLHYAPHQKLNEKQLEDFMMSQPVVSVGSTVLIYAILLFFLYMTLAVLRELPFWKSLGWGKIEPKIAGLPTSPVAYFFAGCGLSLLVALLTSLLHAPENTPVEQIFKHRQTALLFLAVAVLVAPLAEETIFRGYLYPLFVRILSPLFRGFGIGNNLALRDGIFSSIILTGFLFGLMHGPQLGGAKSLIAVLSLVGIVFTAARALTGSVFASYLMHLGYNSLIAIFALIGSHGFTKLPTGQ
jgi:membrane protease YdiL (CAAX protease family)